MGWKSMRQEEKRGELIFRWTREGTERKGKRLQLSHGEGNMSEG